MKETLKKIVPTSWLLFYHKTLALLAAFLYGHPSDKVTVIGVTGTDGKTTTVNLISQLLSESGKKTAFLTTAQFKIADKIWTNETKQTMPGRFQLQKFIKQASGAGCTHVVVETSSQGLEQSRHLGINYDVAVFSNLSADHLEAHGSFENYRVAKEKLFGKLSSDKKKKGQPKIAIINASDKAASYFVTYPADRKIGFGLEAEVESFDGLESFVATDLNLSADGARFTVKDQAGEFSTSTSLLGKFNVLNTLAAAAVAFSLGVDNETIKTACPKIKGVPGRMELVDAGQDFQVVVDYAHAENSLLNVFTTLKPLTQGKIISVLGSCGGGRDKKKRPKLGAIAARYAELVVVTNEDPYNEDPQDIIKSVSKGAEQAGKKLDQDLFEIIDRKEALEFAFSKACSGDVVVITGKGSEECIMGARNKKIPWN
ncbi:UDP-N-acetylmuramyl-tripeptide synthetase, partial [Patescibacteria group bacterium]|nr:UDP-N-acetylmuramyl-tripeptide synthetase [Patescibacteria group bacterium]